VLEVLRSSHPSRASISVPATRAGAAVAARARASRWWRSRPRRAGAPGRVATIKGGGDRASLPLRALDRLLPQECRSALLLDASRIRGTWSIIRTARAAGIDGVVLPHDRSVGVTGVVAGDVGRARLWAHGRAIPNLVRRWWRSKTLAIGSSGSPPAPESLADLEPPQRLPWSSAERGRGFAPWSVGL